MNIQFIFSVQRLASVFLSLAAVEVFVLPSRLFPIFCSQLRLAEICLHLQC